MIIHVYPYVHKFSQSHDNSKIPVIGDVNIPTPAHGHMAKGIIHHFISYCIHTLFPLPLSLLMISCGYSDSGTNLSAQLVMGHRLPHSWSDK